MKSLLTSLLMVAIVFLGNGQTLTSSNLPIIKINTGGIEIPETPKVTGDMQVIFNGDGVRNDASDPANNYNGKIGIELRGTSTSAEKQQYSLQLQNDLGINIRVSLLGMPREEDWILLGPYNDKSLMRDMLAYKLGRDLGHYTPRTHFCEVILNDIYIGVYALTENVKRDQYRVDIDIMYANEITGDDLTGGYILKIDKSSGIVGEDFASLFPPLNRSADQKIQFQFEYPKFDVMATEQKNYIQNYVNSFETALNGANYKDPSEGFRKYIDVSSFVDFLIMQEVAKNVDGYRLSTYLHKQKDSNGGKLFMGPIWDFNQGFGNTNYCTTGTTTGFIYNFNDVCNDRESLVPFWWQRLLTDEKFSNSLAERWGTLRNDKFQTSTIHDYIDSLANVLDESKTRNFQKWDVLGKYIWPNYFVGNTFEEEITWLKSWVNDRMIWLDSNFPEYVPTAVSDDQYRVSFNSYPNPFQQEIIVQYLAENPATVTIEIMDLLGRNIINADHTFYQKESHRIQLNEKAIDPGAYLLRLKQNGQYIYASKIVKR